MRCCAVVCWLAFFAETPRMHVMWLTFSSRGRSLFSHLPPHMGHPRDNNYGRTILRLYFPTSRFARWDLLYFEFRITVRAMMDLLQLRMSPMACVIGSLAKHYIMLTCSASVDRLVFVACGGANFCALQKTHFFHSRTVFFRHSYVCSTLQTTSPAILKECFFRNVQPARFCNNFCIARCNSRVTFVRMLFESMRASFSSRGTVTMKTPR